MACNSITSYVPDCGKNTKAGVNSDVYLIAFSDLAPFSGSTDVYTVSQTGLISGINLKTGTTKYVKYGSVVNQASIKEDYTYNDNGTYDIQKSLTFTLTNLGSVGGLTAVQNLIANPVAALVKLRNGTWISFGLGGGLMTKTVAGTVDASSNSRVVTLNESSTDFLQVVDPTIITALLS